MPAHVTLGVQGPRVLTPRDGLYGWGWVSLTRNREIAGIPKREREERLELRPTEDGLGSLNAGVG